MPGKIDQNKSSNKGEESHTNNKNNKPILELIDIHKQYFISKKADKSQNSSNFALSDINLKLYSGEILGLIGRSGAGKSTLLRCFNVLEKPTKGKVIFENKDLTKLSYSELRHIRHKIGMIFQQFNLLNSRTVFANISLPLELVNTPKSKINEKVTELLGFVGLSDFANKYPDSLSGGQKQRVAIARALALDPEVLLCDEATSALDPEMTKEILGLLKKVNKEFKVSIVLITHEMEVVKEICDRVGVLDSGKLAEIGDVISVFVYPTSKVGKRLSDELFALNLPQDLSSKMQNKPSKGLHPIVRLTFIDKAAEEPIASILFDQYGIKTNILQADIGQINGVTVGFTVGIWEGDSENIELAKEHLSELDVTVQEVGYV